MLICPKSWLKDDPKPSEVEALRARVAELEGKLASVNRIIYAQGAPLGSNEYFDIREIVAPFGR
jgi:hypothetical protein